MNQNPDPNHDGHRALEFARRTRVHIDDPNRPADELRATYEKPITADGTPIRSKRFRMSASESRKPRGESKLARRMRRRGV